MQPFLLQLILVILGQREDKGMGLEPGSGSGLCITQSVKGQTYLFLSAAGQQGNVGAGPLCSRHNTLLLWNCQMHRVKQIIKTLLNFTLICQHLMAKDKCSVSQTTHA